MNQGKRRGRRGAEVEIGTGIEKGIRTETRTEIVNAAEAETGKTETEGGAEAGTEIETEVTGANVAVVESVTATDEEEEIETGIDIVKERNVALGAEIEKEHR